MLSGMWKRLVFFWAASYTLAVAGYYLLWLVLPGHRVFGALYRMFLYHDSHPAQYLAIPCFFYGCLAAGLSNWFYRQRLLGQLLLTILIFGLTILFSSPLGGMLWHYHDMQAGFFPEGWLGCCCVGASAWALRMAGLLWRCPSRTMYWRWLAVLGLPEAGQGGSGKTTATHLCKTTRQRVFECQ